MMFRLAEIAKKAFTGKQHAYSEMPETVPDAATLEHKIIEALKEIYDPEIPVNIYDLGLIYSIEIESDPDAGNQVDVDMTLTAPACPVAGTLPGMVETAIKKVEGVAGARVTLVWDPPWTADRMSDDARMLLGMYD